MIASAKERSAAFELSWTLAIKNEASDRTLELDYRVAAFEDLYIGDRLWTYDAARKRMPDLFGVYRFVHDGSLRLVFAQAPCPSNVMPRIIFQPLFSRIGAGETRRVSVSIALPVDEYSALARDVRAETVIEEVKRVFFVLSYRLRSTMEKDPLPPSLENAEDSGYVVYEPKLVISSVEVPPLPTKRRTGYIARFPLPGEPGPGPAPMPS